MNKPYTIKKMMAISTLSTLMIPTLSMAEPSKNEAEEPIELRPVVVIATEDAPPLFEVKQSATDLRKNLVQDERDLFRNEVGIGISESGRSGSNGFAIRGVDKDRVAVIVDGLPQAETFMPSIYKGYGYFNGSINNTEYENISQVGVNKGANSVSDGSGAIGGSVHFKTKNIEDFVRPGERFGLYLKSGYASKNDEWRQVVGSGFEVNGLFGFAQMTKRRGHEMINNGKGEDIYGSARGKPDPVSNRSTAWLTKFGYNFGENHRITAFYEDRKQTQETEEKSFDSWGTHRFAADTAPYKRYGLEYDYFGNDSTLIDTFNAVLAKQTIKMQSDTYNVKKDDHSIMDQHYFREFEQQQTMFQAQLFAKPITLFDTEHHLQGKIEHRRAKLSNYNHDILYLSGTAHPSTYSIMTPVTSDISAISLQDRFNLSDQLTATLGLRYDHYQYTPKMDGSNKFPVSFDGSKKRFSNLSWQAGLAYQFTPEHQLSYTLSTGFRAPRVEEMFFEFGKGGANHFMPNTHLKPETALNHEIAYQFQNESSQFGIGIFHSRYHNFIDERVTEGRAKNPWYDPNNPWWGGGEYLFVNQIQFVNVAKASISGVEIGGSINGSVLGLSDDWTFGLKAQYSRGKNQDGDPLKSIQPWSALMNIEYQAPSDRWNMQLTGRYSAAKKGKDTKETLYSWRGQEEQEWPYLSGSYFVVDLTSQIQLDKDITLNIGIFNLFNKDYSTWDSLRDLPTYGTTNRIDREGRGLNRFSAPKRNFSISLEARF